MVEAQHPSHLVHHSPGFYDMPFFENASGFTITGAEMNDVKGDYTKNITNNTTNNSDVGNIAIGSNVSKGNNTTYSVTAGMVSCIRSSSIVVLTEMKGLGNRTPSSVF